MAEKPGPHRLSLDLSIQLLNEVPTVVSISIIPLLVHFLCNFFAIVIYLFLRHPFLDLPQNLVFGRLLSLVPVRRSVSTPLVEVNFLTIFATTSNVKAIGLKFKVVATGLTQFLGNIAGDQEVVIGPVVSENLRQDGF